MLTGAGGGGVNNGGGSTIINGGSASGNAIGINSAVGTAGGGGCPCASITINNLNSNGGGAAAIGGSNSANAFAYDDPTTSNAETLLSSNAKFQSISAIAVSQDGVINVADQGMCVGILL